MCFFCLHFISKPQELLSSANSWNSSVTYMLFLRHLSFSYGAQPMIRDISFDVAAGELVCLVGASGSGKSTLLRLIAGLERLQTGSITCHNTTLADHRTHLLPQYRRIGFMFQHPSLFPHLTVANNITFGIRHLPHPQQNAILQELLARIGLPHCANRYPHELSGGQHQRVALARTLAPSPIALLLDEPFANLDHRLRRTLRMEVAEMIKTANIPMMMVTHDPEEALLMADRMVLLHPNGTIHQIGTTEALYHHPVDKEVAQFFGDTNEMQGVVNGEMILTPLGMLAKARYAPMLAEGSPALICTRPEGIRLAHPEETGVQVVVERSIHSGAGYLIHARLSEGSKLQFYHGDGERLQLGDSVRVTFQPPHVFVFEIYTARE
jgi:iron(III) transport system ATP-binding protein